MQGGCVLRQCETPTAVRRTCAQACTHSIKNRPSKHEYLFQSDCHLVIALASIPAVAAASELRCTLAFAGKTWSAVMERGQGAGTVSCSNGTTLPVTLSAIGAGITAGKWSIEKGKGTFTHPQHRRDARKLRRTQH
jgi:hypothetical protein